MVSGHLPTPTPILALRWSVVAGVCVLAAAGCGKRGSPLAPIVRIPAQVDTIAARRVGNDVYVTLTVPQQNIDASIPADVLRVEIYGYTGRVPPPQARWAELGTLIGSVPVVPAPLPGAPAPPVSADLDAGAVQGASVTLIDRLSADELVQGRVDPPLAPRRFAAPDGGDARPGDPGGAAADAALLPCHPLRPARPSRSSGRGCRGDAHRHPRAAGRHDRRL